MVHGTRLMGESAKAGHRVIERYVDLDCVCDQCLELLELFELVLALNVVWGYDNHARHQGA